MRTKRVVVIDTVLPLRQGLRVISVDKALQASSGCTNVNVNAFVIVYQAESGFTLRSGKCHTVLLGVSNHSRDVERDNAAYRHSECAGLDLIERDTLCF